MRPDYYKVGIEPWKFIVAWGLDFFEGNIVKYISRAGLKTESKMADYEKALTYAQNLPECAHTCAYAVDDEIDVWDYIDSWDMSSAEGRVIEHVMEFYSARSKLPANESEIERTKEDLCAAISFLIRRERARES